MDTLDQLRQGRLQGARRLDLSCGLRSFPPEIFDLADTLEVLNLSGNQLSELPEDMGRLKRLKILFCSDNAFSHVPDSLGQCPQLGMLGFKHNRISQVSAASLAPSLHWLILTDNVITQLPDEIGHCQGMRKLMLAGNQLSQLPDGLRDCQALELLRISDNRLSALPDWLWQLPRLAWLACAGNPFSAADEARAAEQAARQTIPWHSLVLGALLGEGASGHIHAATWLHEGQATEVAVKLFKGDKTSDGLPACEMAATLAAGTHPHLVGAHGLISGHPQGRLGLVMPRLAADCRALADPPSFSTCTRDVYPPGLRLNAAQLLQIAQGVALAASHLHAQGLLHGDLYAHNTLWHPGGEVRLSDLGAAAFLPTASSPLPQDQAQAQAQALMATDVRAMGCLLEELLGHLSPDDALDPSGLHALAQRCLDPIPAQRPTLAEVSAWLASYNVQDLP
jgi:Protein tyrosine and serine/threonine kinase/Leucine rich repeat